MEMKKFLYLGDDNEEDDEIMALIDSDVDLIEIDDTLADEYYALSFMEGLMRGFLSWITKCDTIQLSVS